MAKPADFNTSEECVWCPGCGNFPILIAVKQILAEMDMKKEDTVIVSGIGCSDKYNQYLNTYGYQSIHGRILPVAMGIRLANHKLKVIGIGGDGDGYGIGLCHFIHSMRRNLDITYLVCNNQIYGLTTGQTSPTSNKGSKTKTTPKGSIAMAVNPMALALASDATYVARAFAGDLKHMKDMIEGGIKHKGFALIDIFQPCTTYNHDNTFDWFREVTYKLEDDGHNPKDKQAAFKRAMEHEKLPIGLFYQEEKLTYEDEVVQIKKKPLVEHDISNTDIDDIMDELM